MMIVADLRAKSSLPIVECRSRQVGMADNSNVN